MIKLSYIKEFSKWIRFYYFAISDWDKTLTADVFCISRDENTKYKIIVVTDIYKISINNPPADIKLIIQ